MFSQKDKMIIEDLAKKQLEIAKSDRMENLKKLWLKSNTLKGERPMVTVELRSFGGDVIPDLLQCEDPEARRIEDMLLRNIVNTTLVGDDTVVLDHIPISPHRSFWPFNIPVEVDHPKDGGLGHHFKEVIHDLDSDFHLLGKSTFDVDFESTKKQFDYYNEILGHILPAKYINSAFNATPTQDILHLASMETFLFSMMDYPEKFEQMMKMLADDYIAFIDLLEEKKAFIPMHGGEHVGQGTYAFTDELGDEVGTAKNVWFFLDSQETVGVSPDTFKELIFPHYKRIMDRGGLISYGCCEPTDPIWDDCLSKVENLRKVSISPWCNEEKMAEKLKGTKVVYHRKPSPNFLGIGTVLDEEAVRAHIRKTVLLNKGRSLEFTQRDVYSINKDIGKVKRFVEIIREECENNW